MANELIIKEAEDKKNCKVILEGEADIYSSQILKDKLYEMLDKQCESLEIDCSNLRYIDSTGLGVFVAALKKARQNGRKLYVTNARDNIKKLFIITGLDKLFFIT